MSEEKKDYGRNEAARILNWSPRTLGRRVAEKVISRKRNGRFDRVEVDRVLLLQIPGDDDDDDDDDDAKEVIKDPVLGAFEMVTKLNIQLMSNNERMLALLEKPMSKGVELLSALSQSYTEREKERDQHILESQRVLGEILLQKDERKAVAEEAQARREAISAVGKQLAEHAPMIMSQVAASIGSKDQRSADAIAFFTSLDDEQKQTVAAMGSFFEGPQKEAFSKLLGSLGIVAAVQPEEGGSDEESTD